MAKYITNLPKEIPDKLVNGVFDEECYRSLVRPVYEAYSEIEKIAITEAASPLRAIGNILFRQINSNGGSKFFKGFSEYANMQKAKTILKMFKPVANQYAFEIPPKDENVQADGSNTYQEMMLAMDMAEARKCDPEVCYHEAVDLLRASRKL